MAQARHAWWWNDGPARLDIGKIREGARLARGAQCSGYVPSLECFSYVAVNPEFGESWVVGRRQIPFGFGWLQEGANPYRSLPVRAIRIAFRELAADPDLPEAELRARLRRELFGANGRPEPLDDLLELVQVLNTDRDWSVPGALAAPDLVRHRAEQGRLASSKRAHLRQQLLRVRELAARYRQAGSPGTKELHEIAQWIANQWTPDFEILLK